ncbi:hypothetical protein ACOME3_002996 [Neoechinorhynchus agilis]
MCWMSGMGHWVQQCASKKIVCAFCAESHHSNACPRKLKKCANCDNFGHCAFAKSCLAFKEYANWALNQMSLAQISNGVRPVRNFTSSENTQRWHSTSILPPSTNHSNKLIDNSASSNNISFSNLDRVLNDFSANIIKMVDLRITTPINNLEKRIEKHLNALTSTILQSFNRLNHASVEGTSSVAKRPLDQSLECVDVEGDIDMNVDELFVKQIIDEQRVVCDEGISDLIKRQRAIL